MSSHARILFFFFFNDTATTEIYTLSLHDALPILGIDLVEWTYDPMQATNAHLNFEKLGVVVEEYGQNVYGQSGSPLQDRKSTRLNSSHLVISYAVFCLKKKKIMTSLS